MTARIVAPLEPCPGFDWHRVTFGPYSDWWVQVDPFSDVLTYDADNGLEVVLSEDVESFERLYPDLECISVGDF